MILKYIINKSYYGSTGYVSSQDDINQLERYILYNLPVLKEFINIITSTTYVSDDYELRIQLENTWRKYFPNSIHIDAGISRGHSFGTADNDNNIFDYCKNNNIEWLCKSANDMILQESILNKGIEEANFYYTTSVGYAGLFEPYNADVNKIYVTREYFYPQTNFYFINIFKCDYLNDMDHVNNIYDKIQNIPNYNNKAWEYGFKSCEILLKECIERNKLSYFNLVSKEKFNILIEVIKNNQIQDPSHKNIIIEGICHYHFHNKNVIEI
jgi:hypothetical protein